MTSDREQPGPVWELPEVDVGRRRALIGLSGVVMAAMGTGAAFAQARGSCILTPEAGDGPFYLDRNLLRSDITSEGLGFHCGLRCRSCALGTARRWRRRESMSGTLMRSDCILGTRSNGGLAVCPRKSLSASSICEGPNSRTRQETWSFERSSRAGTAVAHRTFTSKSSWGAIRSSRARSFSLMRSAKKSLRGLRIASTRRSERHSITTTRSRRACSPTSCGLVPRMLPKRCSL